MKPPEETDPRMRKQQRLGDVRCVNLGGFLTFASHLWPNMVSFQPESLANQGCSSSNSWPMSRQAIR